MPSSWTNTDYLDAHASTVMLARRAFRQEQGVSSSIRLYRIIKALVLWMLQLLPCVQLDRPSRNFYARGTHGKVCLPWVPPPTLEGGSEDDVRVRMCEIMLHDLGVVWSSYRGTSDSTDASGSGDLIPMDEGKFASEDILAGK